MEKTVRVCDECGAALMYVNKPAECCVCGKELCGECQQIARMPECYYVFCPTHYAQVKEFIEGLKPKEAKIEVFALDSVLHICETCSDGTEDDQWISREYADALYDYMRRERGQD